jgi:hypothetical protein
VTAGEIQVAKIEVGNRPLYRDLGGRRAPGRQDSAKRKLGHGLAARKRRTGRGVESDRSGAGQTKMRNAKVKTLEASNKIQMRTKTTDRRRPKPKRQGRQKKIRYNENNKGNEQH